MLFIAWEPLATVLATGCFYALLGLYDEDQFNEALKYEPARLGYGDNSSRVKDIVSERFAVFGAFITAISITSTTIVYIVFFTYYLPVY
jgi:hypothetical protein